MKRLAIFVIVIAVLFYIGGYILVILGRLEQNQYNQLASIAGGVASILGLLGLALPKLKTSDIKLIEIDTLKNLAKTAEEIQKKEAELSIKQNDLTRLELQKQELEFIVKKASLNLFYKEQIERYYDALDKQISDHKEISRILNDIKELEYKIDELKIEIEKSPNIESIIQIIEEARKHRSTSIQIKTPIDVIVEAIIKVLRIN